MIHTVTTRPGCHLIIGFVDHLHQFSKDTLITELFNPLAKVGGKNAVVRMVCGAEMEQFKEQKMGKNKAQKVGTVIEHHKLIT